VPKGTTAKEDHPGTQDGAEPMALTKTGKQWRWRFHRFLRVLLLTNGFQYGRARMRAMANKRDRNPPATQLQVVKDRVCFSLSICRVSLCLTKSRTHTTGYPCAVRGYPRWSGCSQALIDRLGKPERMFIPVGEGAQEISWWREESTREWGRRG
jgi:hypothetical protein